MKIQVQGNVKEVIELIEQRAYNGIVRDEQDRRERKSDARSVRFIMGHSS